MEGFDISNRNTATYGSSNVQYSKNIQTNKLKIFTWNIWGQRKNVDLKSEKGMT